MQLPLMVCAGRVGLSLLCLVLLAGIGIGGGRRVIQPMRDVSDPVNVFVIYHDRHASFGASSGRLQPHRLVME